ncbi:MAG: TonB-dependent receptor [Deltaproteobacteria bacterium]|jgi:vitamin B12 transporter|nr:TonB-dependent receptor [Deltaproteobacteria bacterium]
MRISVLRVFLLSGFLILGISQNVKSQDSDLGTVVVTSSRSEEDIREVSTNITVINEERITNSAANTLEEILSEEGFTVTKNVGNLGHLSIRGFSTDDMGMDLGSHVLLLLNGRRMGTGNISMISLANVSRIEVIRGPAAVQYGSAAMGGVINIITKKGWGEPLSIYVKGSYGSYNTAKENVKVSGSHRNFDFAVGLFHSKNGSYKLGNGLRYNNTKLESFAGSGEFGYSFYDDHRVSLFFNYNNTPRSDSPGVFNPTGRQSFNWNKKYNYSFGLDYTGGTDSFFWHAGYSFGKDYRGFNYEDPTRPMGWNTVNFQTFQGQLTYNSDFFDLTGGVDILYYDINQSPNFNTTPNSIYQNGALFLLAKFHLFQDRFIVSVGARQDFFSFKPKTKGEKTSKNNLSPSIGIVYLPFDFLKFRAHYSQAFAMPTPIQLTADYENSSGVHYQGDPKLQPETSDSYEVGVDYTGKYTEATLSYFWSKTRNFIESTRPNPLERVYKNMDKAYRSGVEFSVGVDLGGFLGGDFVLKPSLSLTHMFIYKTRSTPIDSYVTLTDLEADVISAGLYFNHESFGLAANLRISKHSEYFNANGTVARPGYEIVTLFIKKRVYSFENLGKVSVVLEINNFTDELYRSTNSEYYMPGRNLHFGLIYEY